MGENAGRLLRIAAIVLFSLTAAINLLGGIGTTCVAFGLKAEFRESFTELADFFWLYQVLVIVTIAIGAGGIYASYTLSKGRRNAFRDAIVILIAGCVAGVIHYAASQILRGSAAPANIKFFTNAITLLYFLILRIPSIWKYIDFSSNADQVDGATAGGLAATVVGLALLTIPSWASSSHTLGERNWVNVIGQPLEVGGFFLVFAGLGMLTWAAAVLVQRGLQRSGDKAAI